jgi:hypothetical protein
MRRGFITTVVCRANASECLLEGSHLCAVVNRMIRTSTARGVSPSYRPDAGTTDDLQEPSQFQCRPRELYHDQLVDLLRRCFGPAAVAAEGFSVSPVPSFCIQARAVGARPGRDSLTTQAFVRNARTADAHVCRPPGRSCGTEPAPARRPPGCFSGASSGRRSRRNRHGGGTGQSTAGRGRRQLLRRGEYAAIR